ncbi:hypothetical protein [Corynebacterium heidelbergense]|uniref:Uncharacterized protein n=1 Tax=Corynebacterium heidelbergense TaxID=2055947 RepID=A0A364VBP3_9CORY|nr:hypothetical protein [Corynebacterium heidelbergense]RAV34057.1 hypothetical protein CWC39_05305 [Corynebacterium heidelbergense]WCZ35646.1 hypothetical protein CHEID_00320 [Corynebacterium heidelbergense]
MLTSLTTRAKNAAITFPQVYTPTVAARIVRSLTSGGSQSAKVGQPTSGGLGARHHYGVTIGNPGPRYAPKAPANGRTSGIAYAQAAAAQLPTDAASCKS